MTRIGRLKRRRGGQALMELSLVAVFLVTLALGIIQIGVIVSTVNTLSQLSRDTTRYAANNAIKDTNFGSTTKSYWSGYLQTECANTSVKYSDLGLSITPSSVTTADTPITLTLTYDLRNKMFIPTSFPGFGAFATVKTMSCTMADLS